MREARFQTWLMALAFRENIVVTEQETEAKIGRLALASGKDKAELTGELRKSGALYELQDKILAEKALNFLYGKAKKIIVDQNGAVVQPQNGSAGA